LESLNGRFTKYREVYILQIASNLTMLNLNANFLITLSDDYSRSLSISMPTSSSLSSVSSDDVLLHRCNDFWVCKNKQCMQCQWRYWQSFYWGIDWHTIQHSVFPGLCIEGPIVMWMSSIIISTWLGRGRSLSGAGFTPFFFFFFFFFYGKDNQWSMV